MFGSDHPLLREDEAAEDDRYGVQNVEQRVCVLEGDLVATREFEARPAHHLHKRCPVHPPATLAFLPLGAELTELGQPKDGEGACEAAELQFVELEDVPARVRGACEVRGTARR